MVKLGSLLLIGGSTIVLLGFSGIMVNWKHDDIAKAYPILPDLEKSSNLENYTSEEPQKDFRVEAEEQQQSDAYEPEYQEVFVPEFRPKLPDNFEEDSEAWDCYKAGGSFEFCKTLNHKYVPPLSEWEQLEQERRNQWTWKFWTW